MASNKVAPSPKKEDEMSKPTQPLGEIQEVGDEEDQGQVKPKCHPFNMIVFSSERACFVINSS